MAELPLVDTPQNPNQHISITIIDESIRQAENALKQLQNSLDQGNKQIQQLTANSYAVQGQISVLREIKKKIVELEAAAS